MKILTIEAAFLVWTILKFSLDCFEIGLFCATEKDEFITCNSFTRVLSYMTVFSERKFFKKSLEKFGRRSINVIILRVFFFFFSCFSSTASFILSFD